MSRSDVRYKTVLVDDLSIFYREAGSPENPTLLLLHGFPSSSFMYRDLLADLSDRFHLVAPDYPGFGNSAMPTVDEFEYTFDHLADVVEKFTEALKLDKYALYVQDYGAPIGFRLATRHPERVTAIIAQNGNAYEEGLTAFWKPLQEGLWANRNEETEKPLRGLLTPEGARFLYVTGARDPERISPDDPDLAYARLSRPGNDAIQLALFYDYRNNPPLYPQWQAYFRQHQPPTLIVWGKNDPAFSEAGAQAFLRDLPNAELHLFDTSHFALEEEADAIAGHIRHFLSAHSA